MGVVLVVDPLAHQREADLQKAAQNDRASSMEPKGSGNLVEVGHDGGPVQETLRRLSHSLKRAEARSPLDDATLSLVESRGGSADPLAQLDE